MSHVTGESENVHGCVDQWWKRERETKKEKELKNARNA